MRIMDTCSTRIWNCAPDLFVAVNDFSKFILPNVMAVCCTYNLLMVLDAEAKIQKNIIQDILYFGLQLNQFPDLGVIVDQGHLWILVFLLSSPVRSFILSYSTS